MLMSSNKAGGNLVELPPALLEHCYVIRLCRAKI